MRESILPLLNPISSYEDFSRLLFDLPEPLHFAAPLLSHGPRTHPPPMSTLCSHSMALRGPNSDRSIEELDPGPF